MTDAPLLGDIMRCSVLKRTNLTWFSLVALDLLDLNAVHNWHLSMVSKRPYKVLNLNMMLVMPTKTIATELREN